MHTLQISLRVAVLLMALAIVLDFMNDFHDAANSAATVVSTGVLKLQQAVAMAVVCNVIAIFIFHLKVATTAGRDAIDPSIVNHYVIFGALVGAIAWNIITWYYGIPSSSSHALIGGLVGAAVAKSGTGSLVASGLLKTVTFILISPLPGFIPGSLLMVAVSWLFFRTPPFRVDRWFQRLQLLSASLYSLGHGSNDAQKTIGIIWMLLIAGGYASATATELPIWVIVCCYVTIGLGTLLGGQRIVHTMGQKITKLKPVGGFCAEIGGAMTLFFASALGVPVSATHAITDTIAGVGAARKASAMCWGVAGNIAWAWVLTIPASAFIVAIAWWIGRHVL